MRVIVIVLACGGVAFAGAWFGANLSVFGSSAMAAGFAVIGLAAELIWEKRRRKEGIVAGLAGLALCVTTPFLPISHSTTYTCWNGLSLESGECTAPSGELGIDYVFPSFARGDQQHCKLVQNRPQSIRYDCTVDPTLLVRYRYWRDTATAADHYDGERASDAREPLMLNGRAFGTFQWGTDEKKGLFRFTGITEGSHFSFTVESANKDRGLDAVRTMVRVRCPEVFDGYPTGTKPAECQVEP